MGIVTKTGATRVIIAHSSHIRVNRLQTYLITRKERTEVSVMCIRERDCVSESVRVSEILVIIVVFSIGYAFRSSNYCYHRQNFLT